MRSLKRTLVALLALAMVLGTVSTAFAGFSDVTDATVGAAVNRLAALSILTGYPDGSFKPGNPITRAEFAAVAVRALGLENAATFAKGATQFSDVAADHWAAGYINVATDQGIIKGYPDGTFKPGADVTYAEALAMLVRVLGYDPVVTGTWPTNYIVKAANIGLTSGMSFTAGASATRGDVARFADNALTIPLMEQTVFGANPQWGVTSKTLLANKLSATAVEGALIASPELFANASDKVTVKGSAELTLISGTAYKGLLGHKVKAWKNSAGKVFFIEDLTPAASVKTATVKTADTVLTVGDKDVTVTASVYGSRNYGAFASPADFEVGDEVTAIYEGDNLAYVVALGYTTGIVSSTNAMYQTIYFNGGTNLNLQNATATFSGAVSAFSDLKKDDVVQYFSGTGADGKAKHIIIVTRNAKTGTFSKLTDTKATVGGVDYSFTAGSGVDASLLGKDVTVLLNKDGKIVSMAAVSTTVTAQTAVVSDKITDLATVDGLKNYLKFLKADGTKATFEVGTLKTGTGYAALADVAAGDVVSYTVSSSGLVDSLKLLYDDGLTSLNITAVDDKNDLVNSLVVSGSTVIFNYKKFKATGGTVADITTATWADVEANKDGIAGYVLADGAKASLIVMTAGSAATSDETYGLYTGKYQTWDGSALTTMLTVMSGSTVADYVYSAGGIPASANTVIKFTLSGSKITITGTEPGLDTATSGLEYRVTAIEGNLVTVKGYDGITENETKYYVVNSTTQYFDLTDTSAPKAITFANLSVGAKVKVYAEAITGGSNKLAKVISLIE